MGLLQSSLLAAKNTVKRNGPRAHRRRRVIQRFDDKVGLLYFGLVDQYTDEHHIVRGLTASSTHRDDHYSIGDYEGYETTLVYREDVHSDKAGALSNKNVMICEVKLKTGYDVPRTVIESRQHASKYFSELPTLLQSLKPIRLGAFEEYSQELTSRYTFYSAPSHSIEVQRLFPAKVARVIGAHFWPLSAEIDQGYVYLYAENQPVSNHLLNMLLADAAWLAKQIDTEAYLI